MDPTATLNRLRALVAEVHSTDTSDDRQAYLAEEFAEAFDALDGWMKAGGFLPKQWRPR